MKSFKKFLLTILIKLGFYDSPDFLSQIVSDHPSRDNLPKDLVLVVGGPGFKKWAYLKCPCGCGDFIMLSLSKKTRPSWSVSLDFFNRPTIYPSIRQISGCMSHFWIKKGCVKWCEDSRRLQINKINIRKTAMIQLPKEKYIQIDEKLPIGIFDLQHKILRPNIDFLLAAAVHDSFKNQKKPETKIDIAAVCFRDSVEVACDVVYALRKANENLIWYREEHPDAPLEMEACRYSKFYADDAALRLYASGEHIANFLINFLDIPANDIKRFKKNNTSTSSAVGKYLNATSNNQDIPQYINILLNGNSWLNTLDYRNHWVHEQPPLMDGQGIVYERKSRLKKTEKGYTVGITLGDRPKFTIDSLLSMVTSATNDFVSLLDKLATILFNHIDLLGIKFK